LKDYREEHPEVTVLDPPNAIQHLHNRQSMLQEVADLNLSNGYGNFSYCVGIHILANRFM
jgi:inositol-1,3,4-trisphosphate 5/6-kinase/inositol-tetrakisphosphate 1-kinase